MSDRIIFFDTTLRDGEQVPGCQLNTIEKIEVARQLEQLGVDVIEVSLLWPFGYGLSYTRFEYSDLQVDRDQFCGPDEDLNVSVKVRNVGSVKGKESVLLYSSDLVASVVPDNKRLRAFTKIELMPGESKTVSFRLKAKDLAFIDAEGNWRLEEGDFLFKAGNLSKKITCSETSFWDVP